WSGGDARAKRRSRGRRGWRPGLRRRGDCAAVAMAGSFARSVLCGLRLLADQSQFLPGAIRTAAGDHGRMLSVVRHQTWKVVEPGGTARCHFTAGLLGAHRIRLRTPVVAAEERLLHRDSFVGIAADYRGDGAAVSSQTALVPSGHILISSTLRAFVA